MSEPIAPPCCQNTGKNVPGTFDGANDGTLGTIPQHVDGWFGKSVLPRRYDQGPFGFAMVLQSLARL